MFGPGSDKNSVEMTRASSTPLPQNQKNNSGHIPGGEMNDTCVITIIVYMWTINDQRKMQKMHRLSGPCWQACCLLARGANLAKARHCSQETIHQLIIKNNYHNDNIGNNKDNDY